MSYREQNGPFRSVKELSWIQGVDRDLLAQLKGQLGVSPIEQAGEQAEK